MNSVFKSRFGRKRKRGMGDLQLPSTLQPNVTTDAPQSIWQPLTAEVAPSSLVPSPSESHTALNLDPSAATTNQVSFRQRLFPSGETYGLRVLHDPAEPLVDIIFVHGLTGDSYHTWLEAESGIYWPVHLLSNDVPDARIMTYGYDADVTKFLGPVSQNNLRDHDEALLGELAGVRPEDDSSVCSSLYLGIDC